MCVKNLKCNPHQYWVPVVYSFFNNEPFNDHLKRGNFWSRGANKYFMMHQLIEILFTNNNHNSSEAISSCV